jgi:hypothetical protein
MAELLYRETIYTREWFNEDTSENFRLTIIPERKEGGDTQRTNPTGGFTLKKIPNKIISQSSEIEYSWDKLRVGLMQTPTFDFELFTNYMPNDLKYIIMNLDNDGVLYTNTWVLQSDRGSNKTNWFSEFVGIQRKSPGIKYTISGGFENNKPSKSILKITLLEIGRAILEYSDFGKALFLTLESTALEDLQTKNILPSGAYGGGLKFRYSNTYIVNWKNGVKRFIQQPNLNANPLVEMRAFSVLFYRIWEQHLICLRYYLRNNNVSLDYKNISGERRFPHDNVKFYKQDGVTALNPDHLSFCARMGGGSAKGGGWLSNDKFYKSKSFYKYLNTYDFYKEISENFGCTLKYFNNINLFFSNQPTLSSNRNIATLPFYGSLYINFLRLKENSNTSLTTGEFNISTADRSINILKASDDEITLEQGSGIIRSCEATLDSNLLGEDDDDSYIAENNSILSEESFEAKVLFESAIHTLENYSKDTNTLYDKKEYSITNLCYYETEVSADVIYKVHEKVAFIIDKDGTVNSFGETATINSAKNTLLDEALNYKFDNSQLSESMEKLKTSINVKLINLQRTSGLAQALPSYILDNFGRANQSKWELTFVKNYKFYNFWIGDIFELSYFDDIDTYMPYINKTSVLLSLKYNPFKLSKSVVFITNGN